MNWTSDIGHPLLSQPIKGMLEQQFARFAVVFALEETDEATFFIVATIVSMIDDCQNAAQGTTIAADQKCLTIGIIIKRMVFETDDFATLGPQRRNPIGVIAIDFTLQI